MNAADLAESNPELIICMEIAVVLAHRFLMQGKPRDAMQVLGRARMVLSGRLQIVGA
jgi:hypothetical protein